MKAKLSVCIICNLIDERLHKTVDSIMATGWEICIGFNGLSTGQIQSFALIHPDVKVFDIPWQGYGNTKNALAQKASQDWILSLDSDEVPDNQLIQSIAQLDFNTTNIAYLLKRKQILADIIINHGSFGVAEWKPRLYHKKAAQWNNEKVHEELIFNQSNTAKELSGILWHYTANSIVEIKEKNNQYALLSAENMYQKGQKANMLRPASAAIMAFIKQYILKKGILDGKIGWALAKESARYSFLKYNGLRKLMQSKD